jgi:hypothetical protein
MLMLIFFAACKKEKKDTASPRVVISNPASGAAFNMFDTIKVTASVSDETQLTSVVVGLSDANNSAVQYSYAVPLQGNSFTFNIDYYLVNQHLASGFYCLTVTANDGSNSTYASAKIHITESPTQRTGYFIVTASQPKLIHECGLNLAVQNSISLATGFNGMAFGAYYQQLYINGNLYQPFQAYDATANGITWNYPYDNSGLPYFTSVTTDGKKAYMGYFSGDIGSATFTGMPSTSYSSGSTTLYPYYFTLTTDYGVGAFKDKFGGSDKLYSFLRSSGQVHNSLFSPLQVLGIFERSTDQLFVVGNNASNQAVYYLFNVSTNGLQGPFTLPAGRLLSVQAVNTDYLALALDDGKIYGHQHSNGNSTVLANLKAQQISYHPKLGELFAASSSTLYSYSLSTNYVMTLTGSATASDSILAFEVITNK